MLQAVIVPVTPFRQNCTVLWDDASRIGAVVDPGGDLDRVEGAIAEHRVQVEKVLVTHGHLDHAGGVAELAERLGVPIEGPHPDDAFWIEAIPQHAARCGFAGRSFTPDRWLHGGDEVTVGALRFAVRHCPGHTPGHVVFFDAERRLAIVGDVLFRGSVGRSDLPRGNHEQLIRAIRSELWPLGEDVSFIPGHGDMSTFGYERKTNPYCADLVEL
jgi:glyoxylase-like metal-dependent hydrolase (beta-lactamase superfamily II)